MKQSLMEQLKEQRWDDHRYYHQSRVNQFLHLISAMSFLGSYVLLFINPPLAALIAWLVAMTLRQSGHFFFEPKGYDNLNKASHEFKESIKVGYNLRRKQILIGVWAALPLLLIYKPDLFGLLEPHQSIEQLILNVGWVWLWLGVAAVLARMLWLFATQNLATGVIWVFKILTDPLHDVALYRRSPMQLMRGEWFETELARH
jgi:hypothetical protein